MMIYISTVKDQGKNNLTVKEKYKKCSSHTLTVEDKENKSSYVEDKLKESSMDIENVYDKYKKGSTMEYKGKILSKLHSKCRIKRQ